MLLPAAGEPRIICPAFEQGSLVAELAIDADLLLWEEDEDPVQLVGKLLAPGDTLAIDPLLPFAVGERLRRTSALVDGSSAIAGLRMIKSPSELAWMGQAKAMTSGFHRRAGRIWAPGCGARAEKQK